MDAVTQWINKGMPYEEGVLLYASLPTHNKILLKNFQKKQSILFKDKLEYELKKMLSTIVKPVQTPEKKPTNIVEYIAEKTQTETTKQAIYFHELPQELRPILFQANQLFKEMCLLKVQLNELPAHAEKKALSIQIDISKKQKLNASCWAKIDYWQAHKIAPKTEASIFSTLAPAELLRKEQYLYAAISKLNKRLIENRKELKSATSVADSNKITRAIAKQEANLITKNDELINIKRLIHGN